MVGVRYLGMNVSEVTIAIARKLMVLHCSLARSKLGPRTACDVSMTFQPSFSCLILLLSSAPLVPFQLRSFCHRSRMSSRCFVHDLFSVLHYVWKYVPNLWYGEQIDTISTMWGSPNNNYITSSLLELDRVSRLGSAASVHPWSFDSATTSTTQQPFLLHAD